MLYRINANILTTICNKRSRDQHTNHSEDYPEDAAVYEPKHVAGNTTNTSN